MPRSPISNLLILLALSLLIGITACALSPINTPGQSEGTRESVITQSPEEEIQGNNLDFELFEGQETLIVIEEVVIILLLLATVVGIAARQFRVPYTVGLVIMGLFLTLLPQVGVDIQPNLILSLLVPPLIFEGAFHLNFNDLRRNLLPILTFAVPGVVLTMIVVSIITSLGTNIPLSYTLVFGAVVAAIDPVAVIALFKTMGVPKRLEVLLEGESLLNDGTAIVLFSLVIPIATQSASFDFLSSVVDFIRISGGGIAVGLVLGTLISQAILRIDDYLIETTLTTVLAFGSYLIAEQLFHVSGVLAVVVAGLINGNIGPEGMSPTTRIVLFNFWEYASFIANSFIFLLIGLQIDLSSLFTSWQFIMIAILGVLVARGITIYGLAWVGRDIPIQWLHVMNWGGLRGAISLALALSLPLALGQARTQLQVMTFGVVIFTLLIQGLTMGPLVRRLKLSERSETQLEYERRHARAIATRAAYDHLARRHRNGLLSEHTWQTVSPILKQHNQALISATAEVIISHPELEAEEMEIARKESLQAQRSTLGSLMKDGVISDSTYSQLVSEVDAAITSRMSNWPDIIRQQTGNPSNINRLITAIIQEQDLENALSSLTKLGFSVTHLPSAGGFLGRRNLTLLIGISEGQEAAAV
jgi:monovalent cation:H+ antiporter, CPA1 family